jgi:hypothetical protein
VCLGPRVIDWAIGSCDRDGEVRYRGRQFAFRVRATVRFSSARGGSPFPHQEFSAQSV